MSFELQEASNIEIDDYLKKYKLYGGCYSCLHLPKIQNKIYIINQDLNPHGHGTHWVLVSNIEPHRIIYFDPFGLSSNIPIDKFMKTSHKPIYYSNEDYQNINSQACGYYCIYCAEQLCKGRKFNDILKDFTKNTMKNEKVLNHYFLI